MGELLAVTCDSCGEPMVLGREHAGRRRLRLDLPEPRLPGAGCRGAGGRGPGGGWASSDSSCSALKAAPGGGRSQDG